MRGSRKKGNAVQQPAVQQKGGEIVQGRNEELRPSSSSSATGVSRVTEASFELRKGPIPDAEELIRYRQAHPDAPDIILAEFRVQAAHRRMMERRAIGLDRKELDAQIRSERIGVGSETR